jgi:hypothetical protein
MPPLSPAIGHQHRSAQREQVLAQRVGDRVVVSHGAQRTAVRRLGDPADEQVHQRAHDDRDGGEGPLVAGRLGVVLPLQRLRDQRQAGVPVQQRAVVRDQQVEQHRGDEQAHGGEVAAQPAADQERERQRDQAADYGRADPRERERQVPAPDVGLESAVR